MLKAVAKALNLNSSTARQVLRLVEGLPPAYEERHALYRRFEQLALQVKILERRLDNAIPSFTRAPIASQSPAPSTEQFLEEARASNQIESTKVIFARAAALVGEMNPLSDDVYTRAEIEAILRSEFGITRDRAQSYSRRAIKKLDPDNPKRKTKNAGLGRRVSDAQREKMEQYYAQGLTITQIARKLGADVKTVSIHLGFQAPKAKKPGKIESQD